MEASPSIQASEVWETDSLSFSRGCRLCIQAESGSGKTSLISFIYGNRRDFKGEILFDSTPVRDLDVERWCELRRRSLALLPQEMRLFPELTAMQNIRLKNQLTDFKTEAEITYMLAELGIDHLKDRPAGKLSVGQMQRVAIVRTLCQPADFIILDEPVSHLDERNNLTAAAMVEREAEAQGAGIITTSVGNPLLLSRCKTIKL